MEKEENVIEELKKIYPSAKPKKKFVYLDKYDAYKELTDNKIRLLERSLNGCFIAIAVLALILVVIVINK